MTYKDRTREPGTIEYISTKDEDRPEWGVISITVRFKGLDQAFQACVGDKHVRACAQAIASTFRVHHWADLIGLDCYALRSFSSPGAVIYGLESPQGRRITQADLCRLVGVAPVDPLTKLRKSLTDDIAHWERHIAEDKESLINAHVGYVDWDSAE